MLRAIKGEGLKARALRGSAWTIIGFGGGQVLRLGSNLILTRILFPEAFGLMALVHLFLMGLGLFSNLGIRASIIQNPRSNDPAFLNTAWTIQIIRGTLLWLGACALAWPAAQFYSTPMLMELLPVAGLTALIAGCFPTRLFTANRDLALGRITAINLTAQIVTVSMMVVLAWYTESVWSLVIGSVAGELAKLALYLRLLPGITNRLAWDASAVRELISFGKWIFLSTACTFVLSQSDRAVLGKFLSLDELGVYNIGFFLASVPLMLARACSDKVIFPLYRHRPPHESVANRVHIRKARALLNGFLLTLNLPLMFFGVWLIELMYDPRYAMAGPIVVLIACTQIPTIIWINYGSVLLTVGLSRHFAILVSLSAALQLALLLAGIWLFGLPGAICAPGLSTLLIYPVIAILVRPHGAWDPLHDVVSLAIGSSMVALACWWHFEALKSLMSVI